MAAIYHHGASIAVAFDPRRPARATLIPGSPRGAYALGGVGLMLCAAAIYFGTL
jgi:hypothetical protein